MDQGRIAEIQLAFDFFAEDNYEQGRAILLSSNIIHFVSAIRIELTRGGDSEDTAYSTSKWKSRFDTVPHERYSLGKFACKAKWARLFQLHGEEYYQTERESHRRSVCALLCSAPLWGADKAFARQLARDVFAWMDRLASFPT